MAWSDAVEIAEAGIRVVMIDVQDDQAVEQGGVTGSVEGATVDDDDDALCEVIRQLCLPAVSAEGLTLTPVTSGSVLHPRVRWNA